jgi:hypothetical protein
VESDSPDDNASKEAIRRHMQKIAGMFSQGDFSLPVFIHDTVPTRHGSDEAAKE